MNIEDSDASGRLVYVDAAARKIAAIAASAPGLYLNARTDPFWVDGPTDAASRRSDAVHRARRYLDAGASGVFVPGAIPLEVVASLTSAIPAPVNVLVQPGVTVRELAAAGVARISTGSLLFRAALGAIEAVARDIRDDTYVPDATVPDYRRVASMP